MEVMEGPSISSIKSTTLQVLHSSIFKNNITILFPAYSTVYLEMCPFWSRTKLVVFI